MKKIATLFILSLIATQASGQGRNFSVNNSAPAADSRNTYSAPAERNTYSNNYSNTSHSAERSETARSTTTSIAGNSYAPPAASRAAVSMQGPNYASVGTPPPAGSYYDPGARMASSSGYGGASASCTRPRYNYVSQKAYPCFSANETSHKSHRHECDSVHICPPPMQEYFFQNHGGYYNCLAGYSSYIYEWCVFDKWFSQPTQTVELKSFDGYLVYGNDTESGVITMDKKKVYLEQLVSVKKELAATVKYSDKNLRSVTLFAGHRQLHLVKLSGDNSLYRVLHAGKLVICDKSYNFPSPGNVNHSTITIFDSQSGIHIKTHGKRQVVEHVNKAYGTNIDAESYSWTKLFELIDKLP